MRYLIIAVTVMLVFIVPAVWADRIIVSPITPSYDIYHPKDRGQIYSSYRMLVEKRDGTSELEARLIAQYEAVQKDLDFSYDIGKPKVIAETPQEWRVRIPSKFSISQNKRPPDFMVCVDKKKGKITCFKPDDGSH